MPTPPTTPPAAVTGQLTPLNHDRDSAGLRYVYPVVSRRAGGVSIGINLNPNNACNWACIYCQVPDLIRGEAPPIDLAMLQQELTGLLQDVLHGDFMPRMVPEGARQLVDIAFSGNGEPTSAGAFAEVVQAVIAIRFDFGLNHLPLRLISNGSLIQRTTVQAGLTLLAAAGGEVWFKLDTLHPGRSATINGVTLSRDAVLRRVQLCASLCPTWIQSCMFALDGELPDEAELNDYLAALVALQGSIAGVLLYGLARPSMQPGAARLSAAPAEWLDALAQRIRDLGIIAKVSV